MKHPKRNVSSFDAAGTPSPLAGEGRDEGATPHAWSLRQNSTDVEKKLWSLLRSRQLDALKFRRQHPIGSYIVDFICLEKRLIVELDGGQHSLKADAKRTAFIEAQGFRLIRFWNHDVVEYSEGVVEKIQQELNRPLSLAFSHKGRGNTPPEST